MAGQHLVENIGSTARDFCMLERNILSHLKLALLLSLLAASLLLDARLVPERKEKSEQAGAIPLASIEFAAAMACIGAGLWEYYHGYRDLRTSRAFLVAVKSHLSVMSIVAMVVFGTCIVFIVQDS